VHARQDVQIHVKLDTYVKLSELKARLRKRSFDETIRELIRVYEQVEGRGAPGAAQAV